jgi:hypothetical protein
MAEPRRSHPYRASDRAPAPPATRAAPPRHPADELRRLIDRADQVLAGWTDLPHSHRASDERIDELEAIGRAILTLARGPEATTRAVHPPIRQIGTGYLW